ncbi:MAG: hypothetical protein V4795_25720 [Pseudomonadota bacterium]
MTSPRLRPQHPRTRTRRSHALALPLLLAFTALISGCGGGGDGSTGLPPAPETPAPPTPLALDLQAAPSSASSVNLRWAPVAGASAYTLERRQGSGAYQPIATLDAGTLQHVDEGLAAHTDYGYRLKVAAGQRSGQAELSARTGGESPLVTAPVAALGAPRVETVAAAASRIDWPEAGLRLDLPAGALPAGTALQLQRSSNTAPDGQGEGVVLAIGSSRPSQPLRLTLGYDATLDALADGLGVALQRPDGSWLALPLAAVDKTSRSLAVDLPPALATAAGPAAGTGLAAQAAVALEYRVVRYLNSYLAPRAQTLRVGQSQLLVPYTHTQVSIGTLCRGADDLMPCVPVPILSTRELPILNDKPGFSRRWFVWAQEGGDATHGTVQPRAGAAGATYTAPARVPAPNNVPVSLRSVNLATGQSQVLTAVMRIVEPVWRGNFNASISTPGGDLGFQISGQASFRIDPATGRYQQTGLQTVTVLNFGCSGSVAPASQPLPPGLLELDAASGRYRLVAGSAWDAVVTASCPGQGSSSVPWRIPGQLQAEGTLSANGRVMQGIQVLGDLAWDWSFTLNDE